jgi:hypothetical protein
LSVPSRAETWRPGYDPRDLLKLYLYGYLQQVRSSRRLEAECRVGLVKGEWVAIDGSKFRAVSSAQAVREREAVKRSWISWKTPISKTK